jgi:hypothetical protein
MTNLSSAHQPQTANNYSLGMNYRPPAYFSNNQAAINNNFSPNNQTYAFQNQN